MTTTKNLLNGATSGRETTPDSEAKRKPPRERSMGARQ